MPNKSLLSSSCYLILLLLTLLIKPSISPRCDDSNDPKICGQNGVCGASGLCQCFSRYKGMLCEIQIEDIKDDNDGIGDGQMTGYAIAFILFFSIVFFLIFFLIFCLPSLIQKCKRRKEEVNDDNKQDKSKQKRRNSHKNVGNQKRPSPESQSIIEMREVAQVEGSQREISSQSGQQSFTYKIKNFLDQDEENYQSNPNSHSNNGINYPARIQEQQQNEAVRLPSIYQKQLQAYAINQGFRNDYQRDDSNQFDHKEQFQQSDDENFGQENEPPIMMKQQSHQFDHTSSTDKQMQLEMSFIRGMKSKNNLITDQNIVTQAGYKARAPQSGKSLRNAFPLNEDDDSYSHQNHIQFNPPPNAKQLTQENEPENLIITRSVQSGFQVDQDDDRPKLPGILDSMGSGRLSSKSNNSKNFKSVIKHIRETTPEEFKNIPSSNSSRGNKKLASIQLNLNREGKSEMSHRQIEKKETKFVEQIFSTKNLGASGGGIQLMQSDRRKDQGEENDFLNIPNDSQSEEGDWDQ